MAAPLKIIRILQQRICNNRTHLLQVTSIANKRVKSQVSCTVCRPYSQAAKEEEKPWRLYSAVCLERFPVITQEPTELEQEYQAMVDSLEFENSVLSDHEVQENLEKKRAERRKAGLEDDDEVDILTVQDMDDIATEELNRFQAAPRISEADNKGDRTSLQRKLSEKLVLLISAKVGNEKVWLLPQGTRKDGESMREAAERILDAHTEEHSMNVKFMGNAPVGFYKYKFPLAVQEEERVQGAKVFSSKPNFWMENLKNEIKIFVNMFG